MPPQTIALLLVFARNHNSIAADLFAINEAGKYKPVGKLSEAEAKAQDEDLFQRAKLINCGWFMNIIFQDYISQSSPNAARCPSLTYRIWGSWLQRLS